MRLCPLQAVCRPTGLLEVPLDGKAPRELFRAPALAKKTWVSPEFLTLQSSKDLAVPMIHWRAAATLREPAAVILVHAGPRLQITPEWDAGTQLLVSKGVHVLAANYRGSTGCGARFERMESVGEQVQDVLAACDYAVRVLGVPTRRMVLLGSSSGARLAVAACRASPEPIGAVVLLAMPQANELPMATSMPPRQICAFRGANDNICSPKAARRAIKLLLGADALSRQGDHWEVLSGEGHHFQRTESWARVYTTLLSLLSQP